MKPLCFISDIMIIGKSICEDYKCGVTLVWNNVYDVTVNSPITFTLFQCLRNAIRFSVTNYVDKEVWRWL